MQTPKTLPAFNPEQYEVAHRVLATRIAYMMGRKFEEGDWEHVYCTAKNIPNEGWSNLNIDIAFNGLGVEHKMISSGGRAVRELHGMRLMHPSATRSIRIDANGDAITVMYDVLAQYSALLDERRNYIRKKFPAYEPDMRTGWVLWQRNLRDFIYFEEETLTPNPDDYIAEWHENPAKGGRKATKSLWIYEKETKQKKFSVTTTAGAKIQPYFVVPPSSDPNLYFFRVQGQEISEGRIRVWIPISIQRELNRLVQDLTTEHLDQIIEKLTAADADAGVTEESETEQAGPIILSDASYNLLKQRFPNAVSDAHLIQLLIERLQNHELN